MYHLQGCHSPGKPGIVREFASKKSQGNVGEFAQIGGGGLIQIEALPGLGVGCAIGAYALRVFAKWKCVFDYPTVCLYRLRF